MASFIWRFASSGSGPIPLPGRNQTPRIFARTVKYDCAFLGDCAIKAFLWMRLDQAQEILLRWITFKVRELFNNLAQLSNGHALQRLLEGCGQKEFSIFMSVCRFRFVDADFRKEQKAAVLERAGNPRVAGPGSGSRARPGKGESSGRWSIVFMFLLQFSHRTEMPGRTRGQNLHFVIERHPRFVHIGLTSYLFSARNRRCDGFLHVAFRLLW